jgi:hypothetical protein
MYQETMPYRKKTLYYNPLKDRLTAPKRLASMYIAASHNNRTTLKF